MTGRNLRPFLLHALSVMGYAGSIALIIALVAGIIMFTLSILGISLPW